MISRKITSLQHPTIKLLVKLRTDRSARYEHRQVLVVGQKMVAESQKVRQLIVTEEAEIPKLPAEEILIVSHEAMKKITGVESPEPLAAVVDMPPFADLSRKKFLLVLDGIADPGNLGTLLRTALALGWEGAYLLPGTADPYNDKALRAAKGATFRLPLSTGSVDQLPALKGYIADSQGEPVHKLSFSSPLMLILGSESHGPKSFANTKHTRVSVPMSKEMESLNVSAAGAILMFAMRSPT